MNALPPDRRRLLADITPLRESPEFRRLFVAQLVSLVGSQLTVVAVPYQVFQLTDSSLAVGLTSLAQFVPLLIGSLVGGALADSFDRKRLLVITSCALALNGLPLALNAMTDGGGALWPVVLFSSLGAGLAGLGQPSRSASVPALVRKESLPAAYALWQILLQVGRVAGPLLAGVILGTSGVAAVYWIDVATFVVAAALIAGIRPLVPEGGGTRPSLHSIVEGLRYIGGRQELQGIYLADIVAMVFGMPQALFPALAEDAFGGGAGTVGLLFAAPAAGALVASVLTGWVSHVRRQGLAVLISVGVWGASIALFGLTNVLPLALGLLAIAGAADVISAVFRNTILQTIIPDSLRGRLSATQIAVVTGGPRIGDLEAGVVASLTSVQVSVVSGGVLCVGGVLALAALLPKFFSYSRE